ncbi:hypothetical protein MOV01_004278 [Vibrio vulnificus]|nr:hypothetical protein [Vibrio vulnificus]EJA3296909.1 hypothetical protein [Vibrio vulnificus]
MDKIYNELFSQSFPSDEQLVEFALKRHGYCMDNGYYGVTYPDDLDEYEREVEGQCISEGMLRINYWDGSENESLVSERDYLSALKNYLTRKGNKELARCLTAA